MPSKIAPEYVNFLLWKWFSGFSLKIFIIAFTNVC